MSGGHSAVEPPVTIPNTEVKCSDVDGSATYVCVRVDHRRAFFLEEPEFFNSGFFVFRAKDLFWLYLHIKISLYNQTIRGHHGWCFLSIRG